MTTKLELEIKLKAAKDLVLSAKKELRAYNCLAENNVFNDLENAVCVVEDRLLYQAQEDCEGSNRFGNENYTLEFIVKGERYIGTMACEYGRYDREYYYVDQHEFTYEAVSE